MSNEELERYSFSKLSSFHTCKYGYELTYKEHMKGIDNSFALYGTLVHSIMERYAKGELELWDLPSVYEKEFNDTVNMPFPSCKFCKDMKNLYYNQGLEFLSNFMGYDEVKILGVEEEFEIKVDDWILTGFIDLVYEDKDGNLIILDYKSKSGFKNKEEKQKYSRQLYLYSYYVKEKYGKYPDKLIFWTFRKQKQIIIPFNEMDFIEAFAWAKYTVKQIRECKLFSATKEEFYCNNLCNHRKYCKEIHNRR